MYSQEKVDKFYPGAPIYEAMEVWSLPKTKQDKIIEVCESGDYFAELKKDGNWYEFSKSINGENYLFGRGKSTKTGLPVECIKKVPHIEEALKCLPNDTVIVGEIYYPGKTTNEVRTVMGCLPKKAVERQKEKGNIHFYLHDIIRYNGEDLTSLGAYTRYQKLVEVCNSFNFLNEYIELASIVEENIYDFLCAALANGEEGGVLKLKTAPYTEGKRPAWDMIKWKEHDTVDVICIGFEDATKDYDGKNEDSWDFWIIEEDLDYPNGKYELYKKCDVGKKEAIRGINFRTIPVTKPYYYGWKTAMRIGVYKNGEIVEIGTVSSGLNDELRAAFAKTPEKYINRVVKVDCMRKTADALRHPRFIEFRNDKDIQSCTFEATFN